MRLLESALLAVTLAFASAGATAAPDVITEPDWIAKPGADDISRAYPLIPLAFGIGGKAIISCQVDAFGKLQACKVDAETPEGLGFGDAAVSMAPAFHLRPMSVNGKFVEGGEVRIPLRFLTERQAEPSSPPPSSPRAMELARRLVTLTARADRTAEIEGVARQLDTGKNIIPALSQIATALRESYLARAAQAREVSARLLASTFTEKELSLLVAYFSTPIGALQVGPADKDREMVARVGRGLGRTALIHARELFCQDAGCLKPGEAPFPPSPANLPDTFSAPIWSQQPSRQVIRQFQSPAAQALRVAGAVRLTCLVGPLGVMTDCAAVGEAPKGLGFATFAKSLAPYYRLDSTQLAQGAVGKRVTIDIEFPAAKDEPVELLPEIKPRSPRALALARELIALQDNGAGLQSALRGLMEDQRKLAPASGLTSAEFDKLTEALARGNQYAIEQGKETNAAYVTTEMGDEQIVAAIRFWRGPTGKAWKAKSPGLMAQQASFGATLGRLVMTDAGRSFCETHDCEGMTLKSPTKPTAAQSAPSSAPSTRTP